jgi:hypothetical protein
MTSTFAADDYLAIQQLYARYATALDLGDGDARAATFTSDGTFRSSITRHVPEGVDAIRDRTNSKGSLGLRHINFNLLITPTDEGANGSVFLLFLHATGEDSVLHGQTMVYKDKLVKTPEGWRFQDREVWPDALSDSPYRDGAPAISVAALGH